MITKEKVDNGGTLNFFLTDMQNFYLRSEINECVISTKVYFMGKQKSLHILELKIFNEK